MLSISRIAVSFDGLAYKPDRIPAGYVMVYSGEPESLNAYVACLEEAEVAHHVRLPTAMSPSPSRFSRVYVRPRDVEIAERMRVMLASLPAEPTPAEPTPANGTRPETPATSTSAVRGGRQSRKFSTMRLRYYLIRAFSLVLVPASILMLWRALLEGPAAVAVGAVLLLLLGFWLWVLSVELQDRLEALRRSNLH